MRQICGLVFVAGDWQLRLHAQPVSETQSPAFAFRECLPRGVGRGMHPRPLSAAKPALLQCNNWICVAESAAYLCGSAGSVPPVSPASPSILKKEQEPCP